MESSIEDLAAIKEETIDIEEFEEDEQFYMQDEPELMKVRYVA